MTAPTPQLIDRTELRAILSRTRLSLLMVGMLLGSGHVAQAEGSRTFYPSGSTASRANLEWRTERYGGSDPASSVPRRSLIKVHAKAGEYILLGSSAVGVGTGDIVVFNPGMVTGNVGNENIPATPDFLCSAQRPTNTSPIGRIRSRDQELAGPKAASDLTANTSRPAILSPLLLPST
jgi:hypothetical protein